MTVGSKKNGYGYERNGGLHCELYHNDGKLTADADYLNSHYNNRNWDFENMQFYRVPYLGDTLFPIYNRQFIVNIDTLIF